MNLDHDIDMNPETSNTTPIMFTRGTYGIKTTPKVSIWKLWPVWAYVLAFTVPAIVICLGFAIFGH